MAPDTDSNSERCIDLHTIHDDFEYPYQMKDMNRLNDILNEDGVAPKDRLDRLVKVVLARSSGNA